MKILVLCSENATEWQLDFARILGRVLHEHRCTCIVGAETSFVRELASSGGTCEVYSLRYIDTAEPDAYILVGRSEGKEGTLTHLSPLLMLNKAQEHPKPFVFVGWSLLDVGHIRGLFTIPAFLGEGGEDPANAWFGLVPPHLPLPATSVKFVLRALGLPPPPPPS